MPERGPSEALLEEVTAEPADPAEERRALAEQMIRELAEIERRLDQRSSAAAAAAPRTAIGQINLRRKPRLQVEASVLLDHEGHSATLRLVNVSLFGGLVAMTHSAFRAPRIGTLLFITLIATRDPGHKVDVNARVVRCDEKGLALDWSDDHATSHAVAVLLDRLSS